ncbi:MAG: T9SS type A sorting domain-containing protein [Saprospiraceae bacterium]
MKSILLFSLLFISLSSFSQILNGSFENGSGPDLSYWQWTCGGESFNKAPEGGGNWSIKVEGGNVKGCWPGYAYQKIPSVSSSQSFILSAMSYTEGSIPIGIYFGTINKGVITRMEGDTTSAKSWKPLSIQSNFNLAAGDTAVVILFGGVAGGPVQPYGYFDLVTLDETTGVQPVAENESVTIFPNPFSSEITISLDNEIQNGMLSIFNNIGQEVKHVSNLSGHTFSLDRGDLTAGLYFLRLTNNGKVLMMNKVLISTAD